MFQDHCQEKNSTPNRLYILKACTPLGDWYDIPVGTGFTTCIKPQHIHTVEELTEWAENIQAKFKEVDHVGS